MFLTGFWKIIPVDSVKVLVLGVALCLLLATCPEFGYLGLGVVPNPWLIGLGADDYPIPAVLLGPRMRTPTAKTLQFVDALGLFTTSFIRRNGPLSHARE